MSTVSVSVCKVQVTVRVKESGELLKCAFLDTRGFPQIRVAGLLDASNYPDLVQAKTKATAYLDNLHRKPNHLECLVVDVDKSEPLVISIDVVELTGSTLDSISANILHRSELSYSNKVAEPYYPSYT